MTKDELLEQLLVERHLPLPPAPVEPEPVFEPDTPENQQARLAELQPGLQAIDPKYRRRKARLYLARRDAA